MSRRDGGDREGRCGPAGSEVGRAGDKEGRRDSAGSGGGERGNPGSSVGSSTTGDGNRETRDWEGARLAESSSCTYRKAIRVPVHHNNPENKYLVLLAFRCVCPGSFRSRCFFSFLDFLKLVRCPEKISGTYGGFGCFGTPSYSGKGDLGGSTSGTEFTSIGAGVSCVGHDGGSLGEQLDVRLDCARLSSSDASKTR